MSLTASTVVAKFAADTSEMDAAFASLTAKLDAFKAAASGAGGIGGGAGGSGGPLDFGPIALRASMSLNLITLALQGVEATIGTAFGAVGGVISGVIQAAESLASTIASIATRAFEAGAAIAAGLGTAFAVAATTATQLAGSFESVSARIVGLTGVAGDQVAGLNRQVLELATALNQTPKALEEGLYFVLSSGITNTATAMDVLTASAMASAAGLGQVKTIADTVTSVMNAYGQNVYGASQITDMLVVAVREGKGEADQLAGAFGRVIPLAANLHLSLNEVAAALATMTRIGLSADESATALRQTLQNLEKPGADAQKALAGIGLTAQDLRDKLGNQGLNATLAELMERTDGNFNTLSRIIPNVRALTGVLAIAGTQSEEYKRILDAMGGSAHATADAFAIVSQTLEFQEGRFKSITEAIGIEFGAALLPKITPAVTAVNDFLRDNVFKVDWGAIIGSVTSGIAPVGESLASTLGSIAGAAAEWGANIVAQVANGMAGALNLVADVVSALGSLLAFWLAPGSAPRAAPDLNKWGENISVQLLMGMNKAWTDGVKNFASLVDEELRNAFGGGKGANLGDAILGTREWLPKALDDIKSLGQVSEDTAAHIRAAAGDSADLILAQADAFGQLARVTDDLNTSMSTLTDLQRSERDLLAPISAEEAKIRLQIRQLDLADQIAKARGQHGPQNDLKLRQLELEQQANDIRLSYDPQIQAEKDRQEGLKDTQKTLQDQIGTWKDVADWQKQSISLWDEFHKAAAGGGAGGAGGAAGASAAEQAKKIQDAIQKAGEAADLAKGSLGSFGAAFSLLFEGDDAKRLDLGSVIAGKDGKNQEAAAKIVELTGKIREAFGKISDAIDNIRGRWDGLTGGWDLSGDFAKKFEGLADKVGGWLGGIGNTIRDKANEWWPKIVAFVEKVWPPLSEELGKLWTKFSTWFTENGPLIDAWVTEWGGKLWKWMEPAATQLLIEAGKFAIVFSVWALGEFKNLVGQVAHDLGAKLVEDIFLAATDGVAKKTVGLDTELRKQLMLLEFGKVGADWIEKIVLAMALAVPLYIVGLNKIGSDIGKGIGDMIGAGIKAAILGASTPPPPPPPGTGGGASAAIGAGVVPVVPVVPSPYTPPPMTPEFGGQTAYRDFPTGTSLRSSGGSNVSITMGDTVLHAPAGASTSDFQRLLDDHRRQTVRDLVGTLDGVR